MVKQPKARAKSASTHATSRGTAGASKPKTPAARPRANPVTIDRVRAWFSEVASPRWPVPADEHLLPICDLLNSPAFIDPEFRHLFDEYERERYRAAVTRAKSVIAAVECLLDPESFYFLADEAHRQIENWLPQIAEEARRHQTSRSPWHFRAWQIFEVVYQAWEDSGRHDPIGREKGSRAVMIVQEAFRAVGEAYSESAIGHALRGWPGPLPRSDAGFERWVNGDFNIVDGRRVYGGRHSVPKDEGIKPKKNRGRPRVKMR